MADGIKAQRRTYTEHVWRKIVRGSFSEPLPDGSTEAEEIRRIVATEEVLPQSVAKAQEIARDEMQKVRKTTNNLARSR